MMEEQEEKFQVKFLLENSVAINLWTTDDGYKDILSVLSDSDFESIIVGDQYISKKHIITVYKALDDKSSEQNPPYQNRC